MNDMFDIIGSVDDKSAEKSGALIRGVVVEEGTSPSEYVSVPSVVLVSSLTLHLNITDPVTIH